MQERITNNRHIFEMYEITGKKSFMKSQQLSVCLFNLYTYGGGEGEGDKNRWHGIHVYFLLLKC